MRYVQLSIMTYILLCMIMQFSDFFHPLNNQPY